MPFNSNSHKETAKDADLLKMAAAKAIHDEIGELAAYI
jgi:hypothetical protein